MKSYLSLIGTLVLFGIEWLLLHQLMTDTWGIWFFAVPVSMWVFVWGRRYRENKKNADTTKITSTASFLHLFVRIVKAEVGTLGGVVNLLFILFNIAWTQDLLLEAIKGEGPYTFPLFTALWLVTPFVWNRLPRPTPVQVPPTARKMLIAGLSLNTNPTSNPNFHSKNYPGWCANWEPIRACLDKYPNLERLLIIHSKQTEEQANGTLLPYLAESLDQGPLHSFEELVRKSVRDNLLVIEEELGDLNDFNTFFPLLKSVIKGYISMYGYRDEEVLFSITGGTAIVSTGLTFLSMPGQRGCVYSRQGSPKPPVERLEEFEVNIYTVDELWKEITEQVSGEYHENSTH